MCNLYRMTKGVDEIAQLFGAVAELGANFGAEVYPGYPGVVIAERRARTMSWGFPVVLKGKQGQPLKPKPVTNARDDKLLTPFWKPSMAARRCLIPVSAWAEPQGKPRQMTRTWYSLPGEEVFAVAGLWRPTAEWGHAYAMVMVDACPQMAEVHDRMPVVLERSEWAQWTQGSPDEALALVRTCDNELYVDATEERWAGGPTAQAALL